MRMKYNKMAAALLLALSVFAAQFNVLAARWEDVEDYSKAIDLVTGLGLMEGENSKQFFPDDLVDNAELVRIIMTLRNSSIGDRQKRFTDVPKDYYAFAEIDEAVALGWITVGEDRMFYPEEKASAEEALRLMLYLLNYKPYLDAGGGDIMATAQAAGLLDGVTLSGEGITKGELAKILYNSFFCNLMEMTGVPGINVGFRPSADKTALYYRGWQLVKGRVMANDVTSLYYSGDAASEGYMVIDDTTYLEGDSYAGELLGYSVEAVCTDSSESEETVIYAVAARDTDTLTVNCEDIESVEGMTFRYGDNKRVTLRQDMCFIYNGVAVEFDSALLDQRYGEITFISSGASGGYDIVRINAFESYSVSSVSVADERIYLKNGMLNGRAYINVGEDAGRTVTYFVDGERVSLDAVSAGHIISVYYAEGSKEVIQIHISDESVTGTMDGSGVSEGRGDATVSIGGAEYIIGKNAVGTEMLKLGEEYTVKLDYFGYLIEVTASTGTKNYAAVLRVSPDDLGEACILKLLTADGSVETYTTRADKCKLISGTDSRRMTGTELYEYMQNYRFTLILYELDDENLIRSITVPVAADKNNPLNNEGIFTLHSELQSSTKASYGSIGGIGTENAVTFIIPPGDNIDYDECSVRKGGYFAAGSNYTNATFYDVGVSAQAGAVLVRDLAGSAIDDLSVGIMVVEETGMALNADDEPVTSITGYQNGQRLSLNVSSSNLTDNEFAGAYDIHNVSFGDILIFQTNSAGEISSYSVLYVDSRDRDSFKQICSLGNGYSTTRECSLYHAYPRYVSDTFLTAEFGSETVPAGVASPASVYVYRVDRGSRKITMGEYGDIMGNNYYTGQKGSEIVMRSSRNSVVEVVIYED